MWQGFLLTSEENGGCVLFFLLVADFVCRVFCVCSLACVFAREQDKDGGEKHQPELSAIEPSMSAQLPASMKKDLGTHDSDAEATSESEAESEESDGGGAATKFATQRAANR